MFGIWKNHEKREIDWLLYTRILYLIAAIITYILCLGVADVGLVILCLIISAVIDLFLFINIKPVMVKLTCMLVACVCYATCQDAEFDSAIILFLTSLLFFGISVCADVASVIYAIMYKTGRLRKEE